MPLCPLLGLLLSSVVRGYAIGKSLGPRAILQYSATVGLTEARFSSIESVFLRYRSATVVFAAFYDSSTASGPGC